MTQKRKLKYLVMFLCLGMYGFNSFAQDARTPVRSHSTLSMEREAINQTQEPQTLEEKRAAKAALKSQEPAKETAEKLGAPAQANAKAEAKEMTRPEAIQHLVQEMKTNQNNSAYDMEAAVEKLRNSPYVIYRLNYFDPSFPLVFTTGDPVQDKVAYDQAKTAWKAAQK